MDTFKKIKLVLDIIQFFITIVCELLQMVQKTEIFRVLKISIQFFQTLPYIILSIQFSTMFHQVPSPKSISRRSMVNNEPIPRGIYFIRRPISGVRPSSVSDNLRGRYHTISGYDMLHSHRALTCHSLRWYDTCLSSCQLSKMANGQN